MNIVMITTGMRPDLLVQSLESAANNAADWSQHHLTLVVDGHQHWMRGNAIKQPLPGNVLINTASNVGASAARNIGAGSIPRYRRQEHVLFLDDDVYLCDKWDEKLLALSNWNPQNIVSGYSHPFNHCDSWNIPTHKGIVYSFGVPLVISSVAMMMPWRIFDDIGPWDEPGGPGGSEDYALCMRAKDRGYGFAVTSPQTVLHCGLTSSKGERIVGYDELVKQNSELIALYGLEGKVITS